MSLHTIFLSAGVNLFTANAVSCSGEGQHLDAVVGVLLQSIQFKRWLGRCHISDLSELWWMNSQHTGDVQGHPSDSNTEFFFVCFFFNPNVCKQFKPDHLQLRTSKLTLSAERQAVTMQINPSCQVQCSVDRPTRCDSAGVKGNCAVTTNRSDTNRPCDRERAADSWMHTHIT